MSESIANSDFDVNILEDALTKPNIDLTFPLPTDKETYLSLKTNKKTSNGFQILEHFISFFTNIDVFEIYKNAEYKYSVNKMSPFFNQEAENFMSDRLENSDEKLDEIVYNLVDLELRMNLIKAKDFPERFKDVKEFMIKFYKKENKKNLPKFGTGSFIKICYITVMKIMFKMFPQGVWVNREQFSLLYQKYLSNPMSIILLPNHQSHIDYVVLHLIMIRFQMSVPTVIAGENLNVAIFGSILKGLGAIFIKRTFNNELYTERNLTNFVEFMFMNKIHFEVFIEGTRSRDGKLLLPKYGILKTLASIYFKQRVLEKKTDFDMLIQPISITYERIYEADGYLLEMVGKDKEQESFTNILSNGLSNLFSGKGSGETQYLKDGYVDNQKSSLNGKIYVKLADNFTFSSYVDDSSNHVMKASQDDILSNEQQLNLKKLGFKILHAINNVSYIPQCAIVGLTLQTYYYLHGQKNFKIQDLLPLLEFLSNILQEEVLTVSNRKILTDIQNLTDDEKVSLIKSQVIKFFKFSMVNSKTNEIKIINTFELLYYKNLSIHLIIHKCLASLILLKTLEIHQIKKLFYIFTGFLKNEFLFDYDYTEGHNISDILKKFQNTNVISNDYKVKDLKYHKTLATIILPFVRSFVVCLENLSFQVGRFYQNSQNKITEQQLINDSLMQKDFPTTKSILGIIQKDNFENFKSESPEYLIETYNKQYLLSFLFYLDNLELIKIFKNKSKTKAYVILKNRNDIQFLMRFLQRFEKGKIDDTSINYMIDVVDKSFDRGFPPEVSKL